MSFTIDENGTAHPICHSDFEPALAFHVQLVRMHVEEEFPPELLKLLCQHSVLRFGSLVLLGTHLVEALFHGRLVHLLNFIAGKAVEPEALLKDS